MDERIQGQSAKSKKMFRLLDWLCGGAIAAISCIYISVFVLMLIQRQSEAKWDFE